MVNALSQKINSSRNSIIKPKDITEKFYALSKYAYKDDYCKGRLKPISPDSTRGPYERDYHRILYSGAFKRLKHKTQVFYAPENDHISTRMDHTLQVASISETICLELGLNVNLAKAIALGHDLGHAPFGHTGEEILEEICRTRKLHKFAHEANSLRVVDHMKELHGEALNPTYEVRDGIVCHYGEKSEQILKPQRKKDVTRVDDGAARSQRPYTLEGCVVRYIDHVAFLPADLDDALSLGIIRERDIPSNIRKILGKDTGEIIGKIKKDIIDTSNGYDYIATSDQIFATLEEFREFSDWNIYNSETIKKVKEEVKHRLQKLFDDLLENLIDVNNTTNNELKKKLKERMFCYREFFNFVDSMKYETSELPERIVLDYVSGMTDRYAMKCYEMIFQLSTPVRLH